MSRIKSINFILNVLSKAIQFFLFALPFYHKLRSATLMWCELRVRKKWNSNFYVFIHKKISHPFHSNVMYINVLYFIICCIFFPLPIMLATLLYIRYMYICWYHSTMLQFFFVYACFLYLAHRFVFCTVYVYIYTLCFCLTCFFNAT